MLQGRVKSSRLSSISARWVIAVSNPLLVISGSYLVWVAWPWTTAWVVVGAASMALVGALGGGVTGKRISAILASGGEGLATHLPTMWSSFVVRVLLLVTAIFLMSTKPGWVGSLSALATAVVAGVLLARTRAALTSPHSTQGEVEDHHQHEADHQAQGGSALATAAVGLGEDLREDHIEHRAAGEGEPPGKENVTRRHGKSADQPSNRFHEAGEHRDPKSPRA